MCFIKKLDNTEYKKQNHDVYRSYINDKDYGILTVFLITNFQNNKEWNIYIVVKGEIEDIDEIWTSNVEKILDVDFIKKRNISQVKDRLKKIIRKNFNYE